MSTTVLLPIAHDDPRAVDRLAAKIRAANPALARTRRGRRLLRSYAARIVLNTPAGTIAVRRDWDEPRLARRSFDRVRSLELKALRRRRANPLATGRDLKAQATALAVAAGRDALDQALRRRFKRPAVG